MYNIGFSSMLKGYSQLLLSQASGFTIATNAWIVKNLGIKASTRADKKRLKYLWK